MDPEPVAVSTTSSQGEGFSQSSDKEESSGIEQEDPFSLSGPSIALVGLTIAIATIGVPLAVVLTDRPMGGENMVPTALESDGSKSSLPISVTRVSKSGRRDTSWQ